MYFKTQTRTMDKLQQFEYEGQPVSFDFFNQNVMVNASEIETIFDKDLTSFFFQDEKIKRFIEVGLKNDDAKKLGIFELEDYYVIKDSGVWMHRFLAYKLAEMLSVDFELWFDIASTQYIRSLLVSSLNEIEY